MPVPSYNSCHVRRFEERKDNTVNFEDLVQCEPHTTHTNERRRGRTERIITPISESNEGLLYKDMLKV